MSHYSGEWRHWSRVTRNRRLARVPPGPFCYDRGAEQRHGSNTGGNPRTTHSGAAGGNLIFLPIPATGGTAPQFDPTLCDSFDDTIVRVRSPNAGTGCIVILAAKKDDRSRVAKEREHGTLL